MAGIHGRGARPVHRGRHGALYQGASRRPVPRPGPEPGGPVPARGRSGPRRARSPLQAAGSGRSRLRPEDPGARPDPDRPGPRGLRNDGKTHLGALPQHGILRQGPAPGPRRPRARAARPGPADRGARRPDVRGRARRGGPKRSSPEASRPMRRPSRAWDTSRSWASSGARSGSTRPATWSSARPGATPSAR